MQNAIPVRALRASAWRMLELLRRSKIAPREQHMLSRISYLRHVQHVREKGGRKNPDKYAGKFITALEKFLARIEDIERVRSNPLFHYLLARTRLYDKALRDAIEADYKQVFMIGVGGDTRSFRFCDALDRANVRVIESDIQPWLSRRKRICKGMMRPHEFYQLEFDLEKMTAHNWTDISRYDNGLKTLFIAEGVTPYISNKAHATLLNWVSKSAASGSCLAYDAKFAPVNDRGDSAKGAKLFRMSRDRKEIADMHREYGLAIGEIMSSDEAQKRFTPYEAPVFDEDVLLTAVKQ